MIGNQAEESSVSSAQEHACMRDGLTELPVSGTWGFQKWTKLRLLCCFERVAAEDVLRLSREKIGEVENIRVGNRLEHIGHRRIVSGAYVALVLAHRLNEKILPLAGDARDVVAARQIRGMANVASILVRERP